MKSCSDTISKTLGYSLYLIPMYILFPFGLSSIDIFKKNALYYALYHIVLSKKLFGAIYLIPLTFVLDTVGRTRLAMANCTK